MTSQQFNASILRHWSVILGLIVGAVLLPVMQTEWASWRIERRIIAEQGTPVVKASAEILHREPGAVVLHITGEKLRDCKLVGTQAFSVRNAVMTAARMEREWPMPLVLTPRPIGPFDMGRIRVWPVGDDAEEVVLYALHTCGSHNVEVRSTLARVNLNDDQ